MTDLAAYNAIIMRLNTEEDELRQRLADVERERRWAADDYRLAHEYDHIVAPAVASGVGMATVKGVEIIFVNWNNFQGWEVRLRKSTLVRPGPVIGFVWGGPTRGWFAGPISYGAERTEHRSFGAALASLL
jgi:hypothetical protein